MKKKIPRFRSDEEVEHFLETADLSEYDFSQFKPVRFEFVKQAAPTATDAKLEALKNALIEGEESGASEPLDFDAFIKAKRRKP